MTKRRIFYPVVAAGLFFAATACAVLSTPAFAQTPDPKAEAYFQKYLAANPEVARNPSLMSNPAWLNAHPSFHKFLEQHPNVALQARQMAYGGGGNRGMGAYDAHHQWHNSNWWAANNPQWTQQNHPEWIHHPAPAPGYPGYAAHPAPAPGYAVHPEHEHGNEAHQEHDHD